MPEARECAQLLLETIPNLMRNLGGTIRQCKSGEEEHLNMGQFRMLGMLHAAPRTLSELAANHHVTPSTMSRMIDVLVRKAWVARETDPVIRPLNPFAVDVDAPIAITRLYRNRANLASPAATLTASNGRISASRPVRSS